MLLNVLFVSKVSHQRNMLRKFTTAINFTAWDDRDKKPKETEG
jgi:hypothetical protein